MNFIHSKYSVYLAVVALLAVIVGGFIYITGIKNDRALEQTIDLGAETEEVFGLYAVYENPEYGYSFEYPKNWQLDDSDSEKIHISVSGEGTKTIYIEHPYPDSVLDGEEFIVWADEQDWPFAPVKASEYFDEIVIPSGLRTYKRANIESIHTVIVPINNEILYVKRVDGEGEGSIEGEDVYFHLLNSFISI